MADKKETDNPADPAPATGDKATADWTKEVVEHFTNAQKRWMEIAVEQNKLSMKAVQQGLDFYRTAPTPALADWVKQGIQSFVESQSRLAEAAARQNAQFAEAVRGGGKPAAQAAEAQEAAADYMKQALDSFVDMQARWLDFITRQNAQYMDSVRKAFGYEGAASGASLNTWAEKAVQSYAEMQKRWVEMVTQLPFLRPPAK